MKLSKESEILAPKFSIRGKNGFSLIELMTTVALIGILAIIGIPNYNKFRIQAKQSEAKSALANLYVAEKSFYFQRNSYYPSLQLIGFSQVGNIRYNVGFGSIDGTIMDDETGVPLNTVGSGRGISDRYFITTKTICSGIGGNGTDSACNMIVDTPIISGAALVSQHTYNANAVAYEDLLTAAGQNFISPIVALTQLSIRGLEALAWIPPLPCGLRSSWINGWSINEQKVISTTSFIPNPEEYQNGSNQCPNSTPSL